MSAEPRVKRAVAFVDGQNLFHAAHAAFGHSSPNYYVRALSAAICRRQRWLLAEVRFYTGYPERRLDPRWNEFWVRKLARMGRTGVRTYARHLSQRRLRVEARGGGWTFALRNEEKGIDVRIAIDVVRLACRGDLDVALIFSQDQDLSKVAREMRDIARERMRWMKIASAFPRSPATPNARGIDGTDWIPIDRATYDACLDHPDPGSGRDRSR